MTNVTYDHNRAGTLTAVPAAAFAAGGPGFRTPAQADWAVIPECAGPPIGFISDNRADTGPDWPSEATPEDDLSNPFEAYDAKGRFITATHSWYDELATALGHRGYVTLAEIRQQEARDARQVAGMAKWRRSPDGSYQTEQDGARYTISRAHSQRTWTIEAWEAAESPLRTQGLVKTLAEAKGLALAMPCARCGLAAPLIAMTRRMPARPSLAYLVTERWRCLDTGPCEAERNRLTDRPVPVLDLTGQLEVRDAR